MDAELLHKILWVWFGMSLISWILLRTHRYGFVGKAITYSGRIGVIAIFIIVFSGPNRGYFVPTVMVDREMQSLSTLQQGPPLYQAVNR